ncbi:MAG: membrane protein insertion efficiency factor YidD [Spirochaetes bacterium]|nr:membrane protein insertion efficiency factor YidD [Spirochaetota bacterium]
MRIIFLLFFLSTVSRVHAGSPGFEPWNPDVNTGDGIHRDHNHRQHRPSNITSGFQGGAYILIKIFQVFISPQDGPNCRHTPVCSVYGRDSVAKHGAFIGSFMAGERLLRCNPYRPPEYDPVPDRIFGQ